MRDPSGDERVSRFTRARPNVTALLAYSALALLFYLPQALGLRTFAGGDFVDHFLPFSRFQYEAIRALSLPLWNPYTYSGHPFLADIQAAVYYPLSNALLLLTLPFDGPGARLYWLQMEAVLQTALAGFFVYLLLDDLTGDLPYRRWAAFTGGLLFMLSGYLTAYPPLQLAILRTAIWLPLIWRFLWRAFARADNLSSWMAAGLVYAVAFSAGHPQTFLYITYAVGAWILFLWINAARRGRMTWWRPVPGAVLFLLVALGLSAAQLLPSLEFTRLSVRADVSYAYVSGGFPLRDTWQMIVPRVFTQYSPLYLGAAGLCLAWAGLAALTSARYAEETARVEAPASPRAVIGFFGGLALAALLLSYGQNGFLYPLFYRLAPGWQLFRGQERAAYLVALALSITAGLGASAVPVMGIRLRKRLALLYGALLTICVYTLGLLWQATGRTVIGPWHFLGLATLTLLLGMGAALLIWLPGWERRRSALLILLTGGNLFLINFGSTLSLFAPREMLAASPGQVALVAAVTEQADANLGLPGRVYNEFRLTEDYGMDAQIEDVWGASPLRLARYAMLFDQFPLDRMWDLTGVEHVITWRADLFEPSQRLGDFPQREDTTYLHRLTDANPRAWLTPAVRMVDDVTARDLLADHQFDLRQTALLQPGQPASAASVTLAPSGEAAIQLTRPAPHRLAVRVDGPGGLLVISENWLPGWRIDNPRCAGDACPERNSSDLPLLEPLRADLALIGVAVPSGDTSFELVYAPDSVRIGLWITLATLLALAVGALFTATRTGRQP
ncbi:MAG: hypothetical protein H6642_08930 [Caldilineaceae bacterium]|nr:hypothetical protein [Caldilineaceae bacterium]